MIILQCPITFVPLTLGDAIVQFLIHCGGIESKNDLELCHCPNIYEHVACVSIEKVTCSFTYTT